MKLTFKPLLIKKSVHQLLTRPTAYLTGNDVIRDTAGQAIAEREWPVTVADRPIGSSNFAITIENAGGQNPPQVYNPSASAISTLSIHVWGEDDTARDHSEEVEEMAELIKVWLLGRRVSDVLGIDIDAIVQTLRPILNDVRPEDGSDNWALRSTAVYQFYHSASSPTLIGV